MIRVQLRPRRAGGREIVRALFDLQPRPLDSDYEQAFRRVAGGRRALVLCSATCSTTNAARALIDAVPVLARRHAVLVATVTDPDLERLVRTAPPPSATSTRPRPRSTCSTRGRGRPRCCAAAARA